MKTTVPTCSNSPHRRNFRKRGASPGFTLIELMITIVIVAILAMIALPSYMNSIRQSRRTIAKTALLDLASREEKNYSINNQYDTLANLQVSTALTDGSGTTYYNLTLALNNTSNPPTYTATATPSGDQVNDTCGSYSINNYGQQTPTTARCW